MLHGSELNRAVSVVPPTQAVSATPAVPAVGRPPQALMLRRAPQCEPAHEHPGRESAGRLAPAIAARPPRTPPVHPRPNPISPAALVRAQQVFRLTFEVLEGRRGPRQLEQLMAPDLVAKVITLSREYAGNRSRTTARLKRVHVQQVTPRAAEACATVERNDRIHAVAARMELGRNGWRCTALRIG